MALLGEVAVVLLVINILRNGQDVQATNAKQTKHGNSGGQSLYGKHLVRTAIKEQTLPLQSYHDVFIPGQGGRPTLGTMSATCWARGGICVEIRECPSLKIDVGIAGCAWGHKVCCKVHESLSPTVGRRARIPTIHRPEDLGSILQMIAYRNSQLLSNDDEEAPLDDIREVEDDMESDST